MPSHIKGWSKQYHYCAMGGQCGQSCPCCRAYVYLSNIDPEFNVGASLPDVTVSAGDTTGVARPGNNGSNSQSTSDLNFSIFSQTPGSYFSIDQSGTVAKSSSTPIGVYTLQLKLQDAFDGTAGTGSAHMGRVSSALPW